MTIASSAPKATPEQVDRLIAELRKAKRSLLGAELAEIMFGKATETAKRRVRVIAQAARPRVVSFPGSDGYDLWARCKQPDILHSIDAMRAAGRALLDEAMVLDRAYHSKYRGEPGDGGQEQLPFTDQERAS